MKSPFIYPPGVMVAREQSPPHREIIFDPETRKFNWDTPPRLEFSAPPIPGQVVATLAYNQLTPEEIATHIDDDTMAKCMALAINPAR